MTKCNDSSDVWLAFYWLHIVVWLHKRASSRWCWLKERHSSEKIIGKTTYFSSVWIRIVIKKDIISIFVNESAYSDKFMAAIVSSGTGWFDIDHTFLWLLAANISCTAELFSLFLSNEILVTTHRRTSSFLPGFRSKS